MINTFKKRITVLVICAIVFLVLTFVPALQGLKFKTFLQGGCMGAAAALILMLGVSYVKPEIED